MRYFIRLSYNGSAFCGWQIQPNAETVQETLQRALSTLLGETITVTGAGRTDSEVNAINYIAHFDAESSFEPERLNFKINAMLPLWVRVHEIKPVKADFHARFGAIEREYTYFLHRHKDPFMDNFSYYCKFPLDVDAMNEAAKYLLGTHDFSCFEKKGSDNKTSICTVHEAVWQTWRPSHAELMGYPCAEGDYLYFRISADRFLRNMVRAVTGSLLEVGRGKKDVEWFKGLIASGTRSDAGESVPGKALFLNKVEY